MDPRIAKTHAAVMQAATELLVEGGPEALTVDGVVARSGVAKSTVYRHWATRDDLVAAVFADCAPDLDDPDPSLGAADALRYLTRELASNLNDPRWRRLLPALLLLKLQHHPVAGVQEELTDRQFEVGERMLRRCVDADELDPSVLDNVQSSLALLLGPLVLAGLFETVTIDDRFVDRVADQFLLAHRPATTAPHAG